MVAIPGQIKQLNGCSQVVTGREFNRTQTQRKARKTKSLVAVNPMKTSAELRGRGHRFSSIPRHDGNTTPHLIILFFALTLWPGSAFAQGNGALLTTFTNPIPAGSALFGSSVAAVGSDRVLVGAAGSGTAYLLSLNGTLLTTFTNPTTSFDTFGSSVAALGNDRVLVGAYNYFSNSVQAGRAYLFAANGTSLTTFTNPSQATVQAFGWSVAALGNDRVLISGFPNVNNPPPYLGSVFLFRTNGALLTTFTNPTPSSDGDFGQIVAALGNDRVLVGASGANTGASRTGAAYLYNTNGALLTTFTNPTPAASDGFGISVAGVGSDRVIIGAFQDSTGASHTGSAYLFSTNGTLLTTFTNPAPEDFDIFGSSVAGVGSTRVLIAAYQDNAGASQAGSAYLFSTNGTLLNSFTNPTPETQDWFGYSASAVGVDQVIIGAVWDNTGAPDAGSAYLYTLPYPSLSIAQNGSAVSLNWVTAETGLVLQEADLLGPSTMWSDTMDSTSINGLTNVVQQTMGSGTTNRFYHLRRP